VAAVLMLATLGGLLVQRGFRLRAARAPGPEEPPPGREPATLV
jgi:hypothetical protein